MTSRLVLIVPLALGACMDATPPATTAGVGALRPGVCVPESVLYPGADTWQVQLPGGSVITPNDAETACLMELENAG